MKKPPAIWHVTLVDRKGNQRTYQFLGKPKAEGNGPYGMRLTGQVYGGIQAEVLVPPGVLVDMIASGDWKPIVVAAPKPPVDKPSATG